MSSYQELNSFLSKFLNLLHCGQSAKLVLECHQGQAYVNLNHALHLLPQAPRSHPQQDGPTVRRQSPSRQRRRARRALARANAEAAKASGHEAETAMLKSNDIAIQATVQRAEKASQFCSCSVHQHREQAEEECPPPPHEPAEQVAAPSFRERAGHDCCAAHVEPVSDIFCDDLEYSAGQAVPQVDGCLDISSAPSPTVSSVSAAAGIHQFLAGSWPGITRDIDEEEKQKKEREKDLAYIENLIRTNMNH